MDAIIQSRLKTYPGAHSNETWKLEKDLNKCTDKEKAMMKAYGWTVDYLIGQGLDRGQVHHILFGYLRKPIRR